MSDSDKCFKEKKERKRRGLDQDSLTRLMRAAATWVCEGIGQKCLEFSRNSVARAACARICVGAVRANNSLLRPGEKHSHVGGGRVRAGAHTEEGQVATDQARNGRRRSMRKGEKARRGGDSRKSDAEEDDDEVMKMMKQWQWLRMQTFSSQNVSLYGSFNTIVRRLWGPTTQLSTLKKLTT